MIIIVGNRGCGKNELIKMIKKQMIAIETNDVAPKSLL